MIVGLPIVAGILAAAGNGSEQGAKRRSLVATIFVVFVLATLKRVADVTQVSQLGRYYMPVFVLALADRRSRESLAGWIRSRMESAWAGGWP